MVPQLPVELYHRILEEFVREYEKHESPGLRQVAIAPLCLVNRLFDSLCRPLLYAWVDEGNMDAMANKDLFLYVRRLQIDTNEYLYELGIADEVAKLPNLQRLRLNGQDITIETVANVLRNPHIVNLRSLELTELYTPSDNVLAAAALPACTTLLSLETLKIDPLHCDLVAWNHLLSPCFPRLRTFSLISEVEQDLAWLCSSFSSRTWSNLTHLTIDGYKIDGETGLRLQDHMPELKHLSLGLAPADTLTNQHALRPLIAFLASQSDRKSRLQSIDLYNSCEHFESAHLDPLLVCPMLDAQSFPLLQSIYLDLRYFTGWPQEDIASVIWQQLPRSTGNRPSVDDASLAQYLFEFVLERAKLLAEEKARLKAHVKVGIVFTDYNCSPTREMMCSLSASGGLNIHQDALAAVDSA